MRYNTRRTFFFMCSAYLLMVQRIYILHGFAGSAKMRFFRFSRGHNFGHRAFYFSQNLRLKPDCHGIR